MKHQHLVTPDKLQLKVISLLLYAIVISTSCSKKADSNQQSTIVADINDISLSTPIVKSIIIDKIIIFEQKDSSLLGNMHKLNVINNDVYILDEKRGFFHFDISGKYNRKIANFGRGPGEFQILRDFYVNQKNGQVTLLTRNQTKEMTYDIDFDLIKESSLNLSTQYLLPISGTEVWHQVMPTTKNNHYLHHYVNRNTEPIKHVQIFNTPPNNTSGLVVNRHSGFKKFKGEYYINPGMSSKVYSIKNDKVKLKYILDMKEATPSVERYVRNKDSDFFGNHMAVNIVIEETINHLLVSFRYEKTPYATIVSKKSGVVRTIKLSGKIADYCDIYGRLIKATIYSDDEYFYAGLDQGFAKMLKKALDSENKNCFADVIDIDEKNQKLKDMEDQDLFFSIVKYKLEDF